MKTNGKSNEKFHEDLLRCGFTQGEIQNRCIKDVQQAAAYIERPLKSYRAKMIQAVVAILAGDENLFSFVKEEESRKDYDFVANRIKEELQRYPINFHQHIIDQIKRDLPNLIIEANDQTDKENAFEEWANLACNKSANEIRSMIYKFKRTQGKMRLKNENFQR